MPSYPKLLFSSALVLFCVVFVFFPLGSVSAQSLEDEVMNATFRSLDAQGRIQKDQNKLSQFRQLTDQTKSLAEQERGTLRSLFRHRFFYRFFRGRTQALDNLRTAAQTRQKLMEELIILDPGAVLDNQIPQNLKINLPQDIQNTIEQPATEEGKLEVIHADDFENNTSQNFHFLAISKDRKISLHFRDNQSARAPSGAKVRVRGVQVSNRIALLSSTGSFEILAVPEIPTQQAQQEDSTFRATGSITSQPIVKRVAVILINFSDNRVEPWSRDFVRQSVFDDVPFSTLSGYFSEISYGKLKVVGDVYGWYHSLYSITDNGCSLSDILREAVVSADSDIDFRNYTGLIVVYPYTYVCRYGGIAQTITEGVTLSELLILPDSSPEGAVPLSISYLNGGIGSQILADFNWPWYRYLSFTISHEFGHNLGLTHANFYDCGSKVLDAFCSTTEYGDFFSVMGKSAFHKHFNAPHKEYFQFLDKSNVKTADTNGIYTIEPLESIGDGTKLLKVPKQPDNPSTAFYLLEYRKNIGFDFSGDSTSAVINERDVLVHYQPPVTFPLTLFPDETLILDMTPNSNPSGPNYAPVVDASDAGLPLGQQYVDSESGVSFKPIRTTERGIEVEVLGVSLPRLSIHEIFLTSGDKVYTTSIQEKRALIAQGGQESGNFGSINLIPVQNSFPLYRLILKRTGTHFYGTQDEKDLLLAEGQVLKEEGTLGYITSSGPPEAKVWRMYDSSLDRYQLVHETSFLYRTLLPRGWQPQISFYLASGPEGVIPEGQLPPVGFFESITPDGVITGWAIDPDTPNQAIDVEFWADRGTLSEQLMGIARADLPSLKTYDSRYTGNHNFRFSIPDQFRDGKLHYLNIYGVDTSGVKNIPGFWISTFQLDKTTAVAQPSSKSLKISPSLSHTLTLKQGQSFISSPLIENIPTPISSLKTTCGNLEGKVSRYDNQKKLYTSTNTLTDQISQGYRITTDKDCSITLTGDRQRTKDDFTGLLLKTGLNLIGAPSQSTQFDQIKGNCTLTSGPLYTREGKTTTSSTLDPGRGYLVIVQKDCTLRSPLSFIAPDTSPASLLGIFLDPWRTLLLEE